MSGIRNGHSTVFSEFEGKNYMKRKYWIQLATRDMYDDIVRYMTRDFFMDEPIGVYLNYLEDKITIQEEIDFYIKILRESLTLVCLTKECGKLKIAGINCLAKKSVKLLEKSAKGEKRKIFFDMLHYLTDCKEFFEKYNIEEYLGSCGLFVLPEYRGEGIALELLKARRFITAITGLKVSLTVFTSAISQRLAEKVGFKTIKEVTYEELGRINKEWIMTGIEKHGRYCKFMFKIYE